MTLRDYRTSPPGGLFYVAADGRTIRGINLRDLTSRVDGYYRANDIVAPSDLRQIIEDQICSRLPKEYCWQQPGDVIANLIAKGAAVVDAVLGTKLEKAARGCGGCGQRKRTINRKFS